MEKWIARYLYHLFNKGANRLLHWAAKAREHLYKNEKCGYCGKDLLAKNVTIDHIKSKMAGGDDSDENLIICCKACNISKGSFHLDVWRKRVIGKDRKFYFESGKPIWIDYRYGYQAGFIKYSKKEL